MSFSSEIKKELCCVKELGRNEMTAMLYGLFYAGITHNRKPVVRTENADIITAAAFLAENVFPGERFETSRLVTGNGSVFTFGLKSKQLTQRFGGFSEVNPAVVSGNDSDGGAFLRGVFVGCGSVTDPKKEYHLEMTLPEPARISPLRRFIEEHGMNIKTTFRGKNEVLYIKESGLIEDFLTYVGAGMRSMEIMQVKIEKDLRNHTNRRINCEFANMDKTIAASEKSRRDIALIIEKLGVDQLSPELRETAKLRMDNPEAPLSELCGMFSPPISRSGLNHRLKKLSCIAEELRSQK